LGYIIEGMKVTGIRVPSPHDRVLKVLLSPELGNTDNFTMLFSILSPGNSTGLHKHESDEIMYIASGRGVGVVGGEKAEIKEDTVLYAPKLVEHETINTGEETLKIICFFIPPLKPAGHYEEGVNKAKEYLRKAQ
jgi:mannose-6-phosphate isomerase-like protein (cupin superfamily)